MLLSGYTILALGPLVFVHLDERKPAALVAVPVNDTVFVGNVIVLSEPALTTGGTGVVGGGVVGGGVVTGALPGQVPPNGLHPVPQKSEVDPQYPH